MRADLINKGLRNEIREYFVGTTLHHIKMAFEAASIQCDSDDSPPESGQRRCLVEQYYHTLDWTSPSDAAEFLQVLEQVQTELEDLSSTPASDYARKALGRIGKLLTNDRIQTVEGRLTLPHGILALSTVHNSAAPLDAPELARQLERLRTASESDPGLAIGTAKELVETACKTILEDRGIVPAPTWDITRLVKETREVLQLLPDNISDAAKGVEVIRKLLAQLGVIGQSLGELRNLYGTGHGKRGSAKGLSPRHARLAVGASATLVSFLLETHWHQSRGGKS